ncbi:Arm DNA-binding domain-containing protein [Leifsonia sp. NPDC056824]|uniref:Arm DNA-binding domain-containing protein n=1 Tax=Leifsonia sp. NPDC056824 TaxID=3345953 RepID=UPI003698DA93
MRWRDPEHQQREKRGFRTKREAELYNATVEVSMARGTSFEASQSKINVGELAEGWLTNKEQALNSLASLPSASPGASMSSRAGRRHRSPQFAPPRSRSGSGN